MFKEGGGVAGLSADTVPACMLQEQGCEQGREMGPQHPAEQLD